MKATKNSTWVAMVMAAAMLAGISTASARGKLQPANPRAAKIAIAQYKKSRELIMRKESIRNDRVLKGLERKLASHREVLKKNMEQTGASVVFKDFIEEMKRIQEANLDPKVTKEEIEKLKYKYNPELYPLLRHSGTQRALKSAKNYSQKYAQKFFTGLVFVNSDIFSILAEFLGYESEEPSTPAAQTLELGTPYAYEVERNSNCAECTFGDTVAGSMYASRWNIFIGWGAHQGGLAHVVDVPAGYSTLRVTSELEVTNYSLTAFSDLIGAGQASASAILEVFKGNNMECQVRQQQGWLMAPMIWFAEAGGQGVALMECEIEVDPAGGQYVISNLVEAQTFAAGTNFAESSISGQMQGLRVELF